MDFQSLRFFCTVASEGSISKAAAKLHYAQSNLSTKIMQLEQELETSLFYRNKHGVTLTPKGELFLKYATDLIHLADETTIAMKDEDSPHGLLKIGSMESIVLSYLSSFLLKYRKKNPQTSVLVETGATDFLLQKVLDHQLDGAFIAGPIKHPALITKQVRSETLCLISSKEGNLHQNRSELLQKPILVFPQGCSYRKQLERYLQYENVFPSTLYEFNTLSSILTSVSTGLGISLFPKTCIDQFRDTCSLATYDIPEEYAIVPTVFIYRKDSYLTRAMRNFVMEM